MTTTPLDALQSTLAGEHAAVYLYGVVGARVSASSEPELWSRVRTAYTVHRGRRDQMVSMIRAADAAAEPVAAEVSYELPNPARTTAQLLATARTVEERCAAVYADMVAGTSRANRLWAIDALEDASVRALSFGARPTDFPGLPAP